ncbi:MAG: hypothetical protein A4E70_00509 [Syntrophus sp. PtaU1.Bin005]|nr:MAG: hypothetical protein A4E69_00102 [Syntrophus sp. PtaB.Bin138]OPY83039.1 MAG: hypothetical protein A4E70_00509 [Syntrophus sp. PtaU1.Bin005]
MPLLPRREERGVHRRLRGGTPPTDPEIRHSKQFLYRSGGPFFPAGLAEVLFRIPGHGRGGENQKISVPDGPPQQSQQLLYCRPDRPAKNRRYPDDGPGLPRLRLAPGRDRHRGHFHRLGGILAEAPPGIKDHCVAAGVVSAGPGKRHVLGRDGMRRPAGRRRRQYGPVPAAGPGDR